MPVNVTRETYHRNVIEVYFDDAAIRGLLLAAATKEAETKDDINNVMKVINISYQVASTDGSPTRYNAHIKIIEDLPLPKENDDDNV